MDEHIKGLLQNGRELYEKKDYARAEPLLEQVAAAGVPFADVYDMLGVIAHMRGSLRDARDLFRRAIAINPNYTEAMLNLAVALNELRDYDGAKEIFDRLNHRAARTPGEIEPFARGKIANMHADIAQAYTEMGMLKEAMEELQKAVDLAPSFADLRLRLGMLYRDASDLEMARREFAAAVHVNPRYVKAHLLLGSALLALGDRRGARDAWKTVLELEPENQRALSYLSMMNDAVGPDSRLAGARDGGRSSSSHAPASNAEASRPTTASRDERSDAVRPGDHAESAAAASRPRSAAPGESANVTPSTGVAGAVGAVASMAAVAAVAAIAVAAAVEGTIGKNEKKDE